MEIHVYPIEGDNYAWEIVSKEKEPPKNSRLITILGSDQQRFKQIAEDPKNPRTLQITLAGLYTQK
tara:strand:+ start:4634 stop:4831 length:198 start_codon:yes stop_codon:yes gene_type:complete